jgi:hypothetical protein
MGESDWGFFFIIPTRFSSGIEGIGHDGWFYYGTTTTVI